MSGATWDERSNTDWLASNGRWYPRSKYPSGWATSALPPAPEHARSGSILRRAVNQVAADAQRVSDGLSGSPNSTTDARGPNAQGHAASWGSAQSAADTSSGSQRYAPPPSGRAQASDRSFLPKEPSRRSSGPAEAQVVGQSTYKPKVAAGPPPPSALPPPPVRRDASSSSTPAPPGRIRDDAPTAPDHDAEAAPAPPAVRDSAATQAQSDFEVVAGDLGKVLGVAKRRITRAINEAAEQGR